MPLYEQIKSNKNPNETEKHFLIVTLANNSVILYKIAIDGFHTCSVTIERFNYFIKNLSK